VGGVVAINGVITNHPSWTLFERLILSYYGVSVALNVILTLMLVVRLAIHHRNIRNVSGLGANGLYKALIAMLIESCSIYSIALLIYIGVAASSNFAFEIFYPIISQTQVRAVFKFAQRSATLVNRLLIILMSRSSARSLSFYESPPGLNRRQIATPLRLSVPFDSGLEGCRQLVMER
jgi:hypothetical protein